MKRNEKPLFNAHSCAQISNKGSGFSIVELLTSLSIAAFLLVAMQQLMANSAQFKEESQAENRRVQELNFAMDRMLLHGRMSERLLLPLNDRPNTSQTEHLRDETVGGTGDTAVFALTLPASVDRDRDGFADADNDRDGKIDEDTSADMTNDAAGGIHNIDDDLDGNTDETLFGFGITDDDEYLFFGEEDKKDNIDNDGDGTVDEDWGADMNADGQPGIAGVDDDGDGAIDEGSVDDDDEDGLDNEDWLDPVVYYLSGDNLIERTPVPWDTDSDADIDGRDYIETIILANVNRFRVERVAVPEVSYPLVDLTIETTNADGNIRNLHSRIRIGSGL